MDPQFISGVEATARSHVADAELLRKVEAFPTAVWLTSIHDAQTAAVKLDDAAVQAKTAGRPVVTVFVLYDLPGRDCAASASGGELAIGAEGEERYRKEFIDPVASVFRTHAPQRVVALLEPDSLANIATNASLPRCAPRRRARTSGRWPTRSPRSRCPT